MHLPQTVEYALRAMTYMANLPADRAVRARDLSVATGVPVHYLAKLLRRLVVAGLLKSQKGHGGGFVLAQPPRFIRFLDVMMAADFTPNPVHCAFGWGACKTDQPCPLHSSWSKLNEALCDWAATTTLADVALPGGLPMPHAEVETAGGLPPSRVFPTQEVHGQPERKYILRKDVEGANIDHATD
ncbi:MAG: RrF2 family transcriptional regulator [Myxococcota bacterium]